MIAWIKGLSLGGKLALLVALAAAMAGIIFGVNAWLDGIRESGRNEIRAQWSAEKAGAAKAQADMQLAIGGALSPMFDRLAGQIGAIDTTAARINVTLPKEIASDPRYRDPRCTLTPSVLEQVNSARRLSAATPAVSRDEEAVPAGR
jgi:hypothetical protein